MCASPRSITTDVWSHDYDVQQQLETLSSYLVPSIESLHFLLHWIGSELMYIPHLICGFFWSVLGLRSGTESSGGLYKFRRATARVSSEGLFVFDVSFQNFIFAIFFGASGLVHVPSSESFVIRHGLLSLAVSILSEVEVWMPSVLDDVVAIWHEGVRLWAKVGNGIHGGAVINDCFETVSAIV
ncbi:hypothetical protein Tco_0092568 [Tanacetum coccineum]